MIDFTEPWVLIVVAVMIAAFWLFIKVQDSFPIVPEDDYCPITEAFAEAEERWGVLYNVFVKTDLDRMVLALSSVEARIGMLYSDYAMGYEDAQTVVKAHVHESLKRLEDRDRVPTDVTSIPRLVRAFHETSEVSVQMFSTFLMMKTGLDENEVAIAILKYKP